MLWLKGVFPNLSEFQGAPTCLGATLPFQSHPQLFQVLFLLPVIWALGYQPEVLPTSELHPGLFSTPKKSWEDPPVLIC